MRTDIFLQQLAQRMDGDRKAISQAETILRSMIDRKLWKQMESAEELPKDIEQIETLLERHNMPMTIPPSYSSPASWTINSYTRRPTRRWRPAGMLTC